MTNAIIEKLKQRGYWRVEIRPARFKERNGSSTQILQRSLEKARVELRGWDFPHIGTSWDLPQSQSWVGVETDWGVHVEIWRAFLSGQFVYRGGVWTDWLDQDQFATARTVLNVEKKMPIVATLWSITEFWEFAARYSQTEAGDEAMSIDISFDGLENRVLFGDHERRRWFQQYGPARLNRFTYKRVLSRADLISNAAKLAQTCAAQLFELFGLVMGNELLESLQQELFQSRRQ